MFPLDRNPQLTLVLLQVKQMTEFRQMLPPGAVTYVCKNTLFRVAAEKQGWQTIVPTTKVSS